MPLAPQMLLPRQLLRSSSALLAGMLLLAASGTAQAGKLPEPQLRLSPTLSAPQAHPAVDRSRLRAEWQAGQSQVQKAEDIGNLVRRVNQMNLTVDELRQLLAAAPTPAPAPVPTPVAAIAAPSNNGQNELPWPWLLAGAVAMAAIGLAWSRHQETRLAPHTLAPLPDPAAAAPTTLGGLPPHSIVDPTHGPTAKPALHKHRVHVIPPRDTPHHVDTSHDANPPDPLASIAETETEAAGDRRGIEDFPHISAGIIEGWRHLGCAEYLESLLDDNLDGSPNDLPPGAVEEIHMLQALLKEG